METAIIYSRVSTQDQDFDRQVLELTRYAEYKRYRVIKVFGEKISRTVKGKNRKELGDLLEFVKKTKVNHILVWELSRLGSNMADILTMIETLAEAKINVYLDKEKIETLDAKGNKSNMTDLLISVYSFISKTEIETIKARSRSGIRANVARGGSGTGVVKAYGFKKVGKKLEIDGEEAAVVKQIFHKYLTGMGTVQIAKFLNNEGIPTRYNKIFADKEVKLKSGITRKGEDFTWKDGTVFGILTNTIYKGERNHKGEVFTVEPIIDPKTFDLVQIRLKEKFNKSDSQIVNLNPLKNLLVCGVCGRSYFMHKRSPNKRGEIKDNSYKCLSKRYNESCGSPSVNIDKLMRSLYITTSPLLLAHKWTNKEYQTTLNEQIKSIDEKLNENEKQIKTLNSQIDNLIKLNIEGKLNIGQFSKFKDDLDRKLERLQRIVDSLNQEKNKLLDFERSLKNKKDLSSINEDIFKAELRSVIKEIKISPAPKSFKTKNKEVAARISVAPVIDKMPKTNYILSNFSKTIYYLGDSNKVQEEIPLD
jgi:site-specific DNA recombinase